MRYRSVLHLILLVGFAILLNLLARVDFIASAMADATANAVEETDFVRVPAEAADGLTDLALTPLTDLDYGAYRWLELSQADNARLEESGLVYFNQPQAGQVQIG